MKKDTLLEADGSGSAASLGETKVGLKRAAQIAAGFLLVLAGIAMLVLPGQGLLTILVGLNLIKPNNFIVRWMRRKIPGVPDEGTIPTKYLVLSGIFFVLSTVLAIFFWDDTLVWLKKTF